MYYSMKDYDLVKFEESHLKAKKYNAVIVERESGREIRVPFGSRGYWQYHDATGLNLYKDWNHNDKDRRHRFQQRHVRNLVKGMYSPAYFAFFYLW
jgi:hypothetical protein